MSDGRNTYQVTMKEAFSEVFGPGNVPVKYRTPNTFEPGTNLANITLPQEKPAVLPIYTDMGQITPQQVRSRSFLGTPIHFSFSFKGGEYNFYENGQIVQRRVQDFQFPLSTMAEFSRAKRITTTPTIGAGTVKEMYGFDDWSIRIRGFCLPDPKHPQAPSAEDQRNRIAQYESIVDTILLVEDNNVFTDLGIFALVIKDVNFPAVPGREHWHPFELNCISDEPLELIV